MTTGRIQMAEQAGVYVLRFSGDVRLNLCSSLDESISTIFAGAGQASVIIDLTSAENLDSTTLGILAKLSLKARERGQMLPTVIITSPDIRRLLESMGFEQLFNIIDSPLPCPDCLRDLPMQAVSEEEVRRRVLEAHQILMSLNEHNRQAFRDLVNSLGCC